MKKKVLLAMAVIMALGSIKAMAMSEEDETLAMNAITKTIAAEENMKAQESQSVSDADGKNMAVQIGEIREVGEEIQKLISKLGEDGAGLQGSGLAQLESLASDYEQEAESSQSPARVYELWNEAMKLKKKVLEIENGIQN